MEHKHLHLSDVAHSLLIQATLPKKFLLTATYLIDRSLTPLLQGSTPYEVLFDRPPAVSHLRTFGCLCYVLAVTNWTSARHAVFLLSILTAKRDIKCTVWILTKSQLAAMTFS